MDILSSIAVIFTPITVIAGFAYKLFNSKKVDTALSIPIQGGKTYLVKNINGNLIDCECASHNSLDSTAFMKAEADLVAQLEILQKTSSSATLPIVMSRNYKLLKFLQPTKVYYFLGSKSYYDALNLTAEDTKQLQEYKDFLGQNDKMSKVITYNTKEELLGMVCKKFNLKQR